MNGIRLALVGAIMAVLCGIEPAVAQRIFIEHWADNIVVPQRRVMPVNIATTAELREVNVDLEIVERVATTKMEFALYNPSERSIEAELVMPVPDGAVIRAFSYDGADGTMNAEILPVDQARSIYEQIVAKVRDPALLEFIGYNLVKSSVFPIDPMKTQHVRLTYEQVLEMDGNRVDYVIPRSESLDYRVPWHVRASISSSQPIATVYSPSHRLDMSREGAKSIKLKVTDEAAREPGPFRLSYLLEENGMTASLLAYPEDRGDSGYFLLLTGLPAVPPGEAPAIKRELTIVFDRSGSMNGEKIDQVREAANQVIAGLDDGEAFNIMVYNETVDRFAERPVLKSADTSRAARQYLDSVKARGGTNIYDALVDALAQPPREGMLPIVLFLTDGLPTIGQTSEVSIADVATKNNPHKRRIFSFGVGTDVNTPLLERIASATRATTTFVLPDEDVEVKVGQVFKRLAGPVLADAVLKSVDAGGSAAPGRVREIFPPQLSDLFEGDQYVILGQYVGGEPLRFRLTGNYRGAQRQFDFTFDLDRESMKNSFVPRLWASRKIGYLLDAIREHGGNGAPHAGRTPLPDDPKLKELVDEVVRLSREFGIMTEYTAFLAREDASRLQRGEVEVYQFGGGFGGGNFGGGGGNFGGGGYAGSGRVPLLGDISEPRPSESATRSLGIAGRSESVSAGAAPPTSAPSSSWDFGRAMSERSGLGAISQESNRIALKGQTTANISNRFYDPSMNRVEVVGVQQVSDKTFYARDGAWIDGDLIEKAEIKPDRTIDFGTEEYFKLAERLAKEGRQGVIAFPGDVILLIDGQVVLIKGPKAEE